MKILCSNLVNANNLFEKTFYQAGVEARVRYLALVSALWCGRTAVFGRDLNLIGHDAPAVQHLSAGSFKLLQDLRQLGVVITGWAPAQDPGQVIAGAQR